MMRFRSVFITAGALAALALAAAAPSAAQGVTDSEVVFGSHVDLSGPIKVWGVPQREGMIMRVEEINAAGGIHGRKIRLIIEDNGYDPKKGVLLTQRLIKRDKVFAIFAVLGSPVAAASMSVALKANTPFLFPGSPLRVFWDPFKRLTFSIAAPYDEAQRAAFKYITDKMGKKRTGIIYQDDDFGHAILSGVKAQAKAMGVEIVATASYKRGATAFSSQVARMKAAGVEVLHLGTVVRETVGVGKEIMKLGWKVTVAAPAAACNDYVPFLGKEAVEGFYVMCQYRPIYADEAGPELKAWIARYKKRFGEKKRPNVAVGMTYDEVSILARGLELAGRDLTRDSFIAALEKIKDFPSLFGAPPQSFSATSHVGTRRMLMTQITKGRYKKLTGPIGY